MSDCLRCTFVFKEVVTVAETGTEKGGTRGAAGLLTFPGGV